MPTHKSNDYNLTAVQYYLVEDKRQEEVCKIFKCTQRCLMLKSRLQKLEGLKYENLKENIQKVISEIPKEKYENIFKGAYERPEKYVPKNKTRKIKKNYK